VSEFGSIEEEEHTILLLLFRPGVCVCGNTYSMLYGLVFERWLSVRIHSDSQL
jgi:hypothetical protein